MKASLSSCLAAATLGLLAGQSAARSIRSTGTNRTAPHLPSHGQEDVVDSDTSPQYYIAWFIPPSGADITSFISTMTIPDVSANTDIGPRYVWPGMEDSPGDFVFQDVIGDQQPEGEWTFATWYVGDGEDMEYTIYPIAPGDTSTSTFTLTDSGSNTWSEAFSISGTDATTGGVGSVTFSTEGALTNALFAIELWDDALWDFGQVTWSDITIVASGTTDTTWCTSPEFLTSPNIGSFQYTISTPQASTDGSSTTCTISQLVFESP